MKRSPATPIKKINSSTSSAALSNSSPTSLFSLSETESDNTPPATPPPSTPKKQIGNTTEKTCPPINSEKELLDHLFSADNIANMNLVDRYSNQSFMDAPGTSAKQEDFKSNSKHICSQEIPFKRYSICRLDSLFADYQTALQKIRSVSEEYKRLLLSVPLLSEQQASDSSPQETSKSDEELHQPIQTSQESFPKTIITCRFVVISEPQGQPKMYLSLYDGSEGMSHAQLVCADERLTSCISAGVISFEINGSNWRIQSLSNKSGHFIPGPEALLSPLGIIFAHFPDNFDEQIDLIYHTLPSPERCTKQQIFKLSVEELRTKFIEHNILPEVAPHYEGGFSEETLTAIATANTLRKNTERNDLARQRISPLSRLSLFSSPTSPQKRKENPSFTRMAIEVDGADDFDPFSPRKPAQPIARAIEYDSDDSLLFKLD